MAERLAPDGKKGTWTQKLRRVSQLAFLGLFLYLLFATVYPLKVPLPPDLFFLADPLVGLTAILASREIIWLLVPFMLVVLVGTALFGRFFCGWVCPMGTTVDLADHLIVARKPEKGESRFRNLKYYLLAGLGVAALAGAPLSYLLDPLAILARGVIWALVPPFTMIGKALAQMGLVREVAPGLARNPVLPEIQPYFQSGLGAAAMLGGVLALGWLGKRFWCRNLCPLGALLALVGKLGLVRRVVGESDCIVCHKCDRDCKMGAIKTDPTQTQQTECIFCFNCQTTCPTRGTSFQLRLAPSGNHKNVNLERRRLLGAAATGLLWVGLAKGDAGAKKAGAGKTRRSDPGLVRPPGALAEEAFLDRCTRCGICMKACPTNGLQPALKEGGLEGVWTPILVPSIGYCSQHCNLCGQVCPTDAILPFEWKEKEHLFLGRANIDQSSCLVWAQDKSCMVCDEHCSYRAIRWEKIDGINRPIVDPELCVGCGQCENKCPIQPFAAIRVTSTGDRRHLSREEQKALRPNRKHKPPKPGPTSPPSGSSPYPGV